MKNGIGKPMTKRMVPNKILLIRAISTFRRKLPRLTKSSASRRKKSKSFKNPSNPL